ncbi:hypothetical protein D3C85_1597350 [compost metagenome]
MYIALASYRMRTTIGTSKLPVTKYPIINPNIVKMTIPLIPCMKYPPPKIAEIIMSANSSDIPNTSTTTFT